MSTSSSDLLQLRLKLVDGKYFVDGVDKGKKSVKGLGRATTETATKQKYAEKATSRLTGSYKKLGTTAKWGLGFLGVGGVLAIESSIHATEELGKTTSALTRNFGLQNNVASRWGAVAMSREIDSKSLSTTFGVLSSKMVEAARKGGTALTPFHQLGISQEEVAKGAHNFEWGLMRVTKALGEEEGGAKRSTAAKGVLGKGYLTLAPLMSEGVKGLQEQLHWADKYGVTMSGKTTDGVMEMVQAQRENKVAMLGLQVSLTKALMPAIHAGDEQLQEFIATLNSPKLTAEQKVRRISHQFLALEGDVIRVIEQALPTIAEHAGHLGVVMAGAVLHGFTHSNLLGKIAIGAWLFHTLGGESLIKAGAMKVGGMIGTSMGIGLATGAVGAFVAYELWEHLSKRTQAEIIHWAQQAGADFVNYFVREINKSLNEVNVLGNLPFGLSVPAPQLNEVEGPANLSAPPAGKGTAPGSNWNIGNGKSKRQVYEELWGVAPPPGPPPPGGWPAPGKKRRNVAQSNRVRPRSELLLSPRGHTGSGAPIVHVTHTHIHVGSKEVAEVVTKEALDAAALA